MKRIFVYLVLLNFPLFGDSLKEPHRETHPIQGGERIPSGSFQNVVYVNMDSGFCTGTLVHQNWILTAAHCVSNNNEHQITDPVNRITFGRGESYRVDITDIGRIVIHPEFIYRGVPGFVKDAALIEIPKGAPPGIKPIPIMTERQEREFFSQSRRNGIIIGHGYIRGGYLDLHLNHAEVPTQTDEECRQQQGGFAGVVHADTVCANTTSEFIGGGDSGGPLLIPQYGKDLLFDGDPTGYSQMGIASIRTDNGQDEEVVSVFQRVSTIRNWIQEVTSTPQVLPHVFSGDLNGLDTWTETIFTNTAQEPCPITLTFSQGTQDTPAVQFNNQVHDRNQVTFSLPAGSTRSVEITSLDGSFVHGALYIEPECSSTSLNIQGRYLIQDRQGIIQEVFSIAPETRFDWLKAGECKILTSKFGDGRDVGLAFVTARPGKQAPSGSQLNFQAYDWNGKQAEALSSIVVTGRKEALNPWELEEPRMVEICLDVPESNSHFQLAIIAVGAKATSGKVQYFTEDLIEP